MAGLEDARHKVTINGNEYDILPHPATEGLSLAFKIASLLDAISISPSQRDLFNVDENGNKTPNTGEIMKNIGAICSKVIKEDPKMSLFIELFRHTHVNGEPLNEKRFNFHFQRNYGELVEAIMEVITANNFLEMVSLIG
jgi:hypothetical protein